MTDARDEGVRVQSVADALRRRLDGAIPTVGLVLGSGLATLADAVAVQQRIPFDELPGLPRPSVTGHVGEFVAGTFGGAQVLLQRGRFHLYEGHPIEDVVLPVRAMAAVGVRTLVLTNAAGGIAPTLVPPALMLIADHLNLMFRAPLVGPVVVGEERFPDMAAPYDPDLRRTVHAVATASGIPIHEGVYAGVLGPSFETPAEIRMLAGLGADAVGMSTVPEAIVARARGMRVLGISTITNPAAGLSAGPLNHEEVLAAGGAVAGQLTQLLRDLLSRTVAD